MACDLLVKGTTYAPKSRADDVAPNNLLVTKAPPTGPCLLPPPLACYAPRLHTPPWLQDRREWVDKPDGTIITAAAAAASTRRMLHKPKPGVDYYEVLQVGCGLL